LRKNNDPNNSFEGDYQDSLICDTFPYFSTGLVLVTDAIAALGLPPGLHKLGPMQVEINHEKATLLGTNTLAGR